MTILEAENFYREDSKKYDLKGNKEFIKYLKEKYGYNSFDIEDMQELINKISIWYELKYPDAYYEAQNGTIDFGNKGVPSITEYLNYDQLKYRLNDIPRFILDGSYRASGWSQRDVRDENGNIIDLIPIIFMFIDEKENELNRYLINVNCKTGEVIEYPRKKFNPTLVDNFKISDLLEELIKTDKYNYKDIENCVKTHNTDLEVRSKLLQLTALKLLYSENTIPQYGYERAKHFIEEFNQYIPGLNLTTKGIDDLIEKNYKYEKENPKTYIKEFFKRR